jgi:glycosyltransferase involved in cell wall biosynthesis
VYLKGGAERTILELIRRSSHDWTVVTNHYEPYSTFPEFRDIPVIELSTVSVKRSMFEVAHAAFTLMVQRFDWRQFDALMISSEGMGNLMALHPRLPPLFCYCHTPLKIAHDPVTRAHFFAQKRKLPLRMSIKAFTMVDRMTWPRYQRVFCNSEETRQRLLRSQLVQESRIEILHPGVDTETMRPSDQSEPYFLLPGRIMWTKNVELAISAFKEFKRLQPDTPFRLIIAGMLDYKSRDYCHELMRQAGRGDGIDFVISPDDTKMCELYQAAWAVLNTSYNEDWGISIIEGMACGKPILAVNSGGPRESIVDGETGFLCELSANDFARRMCDLATNPELTASMGLAGRRRSLQYDWRPFALRIDRYIDELCETAKRLLVPTTPSG